jgi:hypothetical protein
MMLEFITKSDLENFKSDIIKEVADLINGKQENKKWLKSADVRKMLNISPGTLQHLRVSRVLPFTKIGGLVYYEYNEVLKVLDNNKTEAAA